MQAVGNVHDKLITSNEERLDKKTFLTRLAMQPQLAQVEINKIEAQHRSVFVAGWRPFIGWVCVWNLSYLTFLRDIITWLVGTETPPAIGWI